MTNMHGIAHFAFVFAAVAFAHGADVMAAADPVPTVVGKVATPNHDPHQVSLMPAEAAEVATPNHDPHHVSLMPTEVGEVATPNHDPHHVSLVATLGAPMPGAGWEPVILRAEPEIAAPPAPAFVAADTMLYARANARLRAAPSTAAGVLAKLAADAPLRAIARSTDGAWWRVSLADTPHQQGRTGYVHRDAVAKQRAAKTKPPTAPEAAPVAAASPLPAPAPRSQSLLGFVDEAMNWLADVAAHGSPPKVIRAER
jgi:hypothetical protein